MGISQLQIRVAGLRVSVKWTRKFKNIQKIALLKKLKNTDSITNLEQCPCQDWIRGRLQFREPVTITNEATDPSTRLQTILDRAIFNWYSSNVKALTSEMRALQLDQLSEQILFLFDCVWSTLQSNDTNFRERFELQLT